MLHGRQAAVISPRTMHRGPPATIAQSLITRAILYTPYGVLYLLDFQSFLLEFDWLGCIKTECRHSIVLSIRSMLIFLVEKWLEHRGTCLQTFNQLTSTYMDGIMVRNNNLKKQ